MIDISMQDTVWAFTAIENLSRLVTRDFCRHGNGHPNVLPFDTYPTKDGYIVLTVTTVGQWETFSKIVGREDFSNNPNFATQMKRIKCREEINAKISEWTRSKSTGELVDELTNAGLACASVPSFEEVVRDPQLTSREMIVEVEQLVSGKVNCPGSVFKLSKTPGDVKFPAPFLGEHNYEVYHKMLGYSEKEIAQFANGGII